MARKKRVKKRVRINTNIRRSSRERIKRSYKETIVPIYKTYKLPKKIITPKIITPRKISSSVPMRNKARSTKQSTITAPVKNRRLNMITINKPIRRVSRCEKIEKGIRARKTNFFKSKGRGGSVRPEHNRRHERKC